MPQSPAAGPTSVGLPMPERALRQAPAGRESSPGFAAFLGSADSPATAGADPASGVSLAPGVGRAEGARPDGGRHGPEIHAALSDALRAGDGGGVEAVKADAAPQGPPAPEKGTPDAGASMPAAIAGTAPAAAGAGTAAEVPQTQPPARGKAGEDESGAEASSKEASAKEVDKVTDKAVPEPPRRDAAIAPFPSLHRVDGPGDSAGGHAAGQAAALVGPAPSPAAVPTAPDGAPQAPATDKAPAIPSARLRLDSAGNPAAAPGQAGDASVAAAPQGKGSASPGFGPDGAATSARQAEMPAATSNPTAKDAAPIALAPGAMQEFRPLPKPLAQGPAAPGAEAGVPALAPLAVAAAPGAEGASAALAASGPDAGRIPIAGLAVEIAARALEGKRRFDVRLDPPELGRIDIRLDFGRDGQVTSRLVVERAETLDLLRRDAQGLQQTLQSAGLRTDGGGLQFSLRDQSGGFRQEAGSAPNLLIIPDADVAVHEAVRRGYGVLRGLGIGVDISV